ncbi:unnamed protein product [Haemonchus placei]|uniref:G_PROTEIN_RECEP_F1_2 domain-containing protein n=1 Tax=Haemonchus placei TaxID=6290 RepID=A0A0N4VTD6_HAEPC|nr:unnamed protein product [Haemonchus placei]
MKVSNLLKVLLLKIFTCKDNNKNICFQLFIILAVALNLSNPVVNMNRICAVMNSTGIYYGTVHFSLIAVTYIFCFVVLWNLFRKSNKRRVSHTEIFLRMILSLDFVSVLLVSIPNLKQKFWGWFDCCSSNHNLIGTGTKQSWCWFRTKVCLAATCRSIGMFLFSISEIETNKS